MPTNRAHRHQDFASDRIPRLRVPLNDYEHGIVRAAAALVGLHQTEFARSTVLEKAHALVGDSSQHPRTLPPSPPSHAKALRDKIRESAAQAPQPVAPAAPAPKPTAPQQPRARVPAFRDGYGDSDGLDEPPGAAIPPALGSIRFD